MMNGADTLAKVQSAAPNLDPDQVRATLDRILASEQFTGSAQLARFLRFIVESRLSPDSAPLKESSIGVSVFRRGPAYDPKIDPIVRVEARRLRTRLESYYMGPGASDPVQISLPKGGYTPAWHLVPDSPEIPVFAIDPPRVAARSKRNWRLAVPGILTAILAAVFVVRYLTAPERLVTRFWHAVLGSDRPTLIVPADSGLVILQDLTRQPAQLREYLAGEYRARLAATSADLSPPLVEGLAGRRYTSMADLDFCLRVSHRPEVPRLGVRARYARDLRLEELRTNNVILLGARHSNPWVELFEPEAAFRIQHEESTGTFRIVIVTPAPGEPSQIVISPAELKQRIYGVISFHRNREGTGIALIVAGTSVAGTEAAAALLLDDYQLMPWLIKAANHGKIGGFDILLRDRNLGGGAPRAEVVAFRAEKTTVAVN